MAFKLAKICPYHGAKGRRGRGGEKDEVNPFRSNTSDLTANAS